MRFLAIIKFIKSMLGIDSLVENLFRIKYENTIRRPFKNIITIYEASIFKTH